MRLRSVFVCLCLCLRLLSENAKGSNHLREDIVGRLSSRLTMMEVLVCGAAAEADDGADEVEVLGRVTGAFDSVSSRFFDDDLDGAAERLVGVESRDLRVGRSSEVLSLRRIEPLRPPAVVDTLETAGGDASKDRFSGGTMTGVAGNDLRMGVETTVESFGELGEVVGEELTEVELMRVGILD